MINIKEVSIRNFRSFGDYDTCVDLEKLGPTLIVGEVDPGDDGRSRKRNGAGKTSLVEAIVWAIFGRTYDNARPGDKVVNFFTNKNCIVTVKTTNGYVISRTRKYQGKNDLEFYHEKDENKTLSTNTAAQKDILKTFELDYGVFSSSVFFEQKADPLMNLKPSERRRILERILQINKLNFRAEAAKTHLKDEQGEQDKLLKEKELIQRDITKVKEDIEAAKEKRSNFENSRLDRIMEADKKISSLTKEKDDIRVPDVDDIKKKWDLIDKIENKKKDLNDKKHKAEMAIHKAKSDIESCYDQINEIKERLEAEKDIDLDNLKALWNTHQEKLDNVDTQKGVISKLEKAIFKLNTEIGNSQKIVDDWNEKAGKECPSCKQNIPESHTKGLIKPYKNKLVELTNKRSKLEKSLESSNSKLEELEKDVGHNKPNMTIEYAAQVMKDRESLNTKIGNLENRVEELKEVSKENQDELEKISYVLEKIDSSVSTSKPSMTVREAELIVQKSERILSQIEDAKKEKNRIKEEENPHSEIITKLEKDNDGYKENLDEVDKNVKKRDVLIKHYNYIFKAYNDKKRIKSMILGGMVPVLNDRLRYYLDQFGFDVVNLEFNTLLDIESSSWDYQLCSGGERQCIDLAILFALFDLNSIHYGRQCNVMVLDEVDSRLDPHYVDALASVVVDDFGKQGPTRPSTILAISHKEDMLDAFPTKIRVKKVNGFSYVEVEK